MKLKLFLIFVLAPLVLAVGLADGSSVDLSFSSPEPQIIDGVNHLYLKVSVEGFDTVMSPGDPMLPVKRYCVLLPPNVDEGSIRLVISSDDFYEINVSKPIEPAPPMATESGLVVEWEEGKEIVNGKNMNIYGSDGYHPENVVEAERLSQMRQYRFVELYFYPIQYNPINGTLKIHREVSFRILYNVNVPEMSSNSEFVYVSDPVMRDDAAKMFINWNDAKKWYEAGALVSQAVKYDYIIVTTKYIVHNSNKLDDFVNYLHGKEFSVKVVTEDDYGNDKGQQRAINIRNWLKEHYINYGIKYVLLIGNPDPDDPSTLDTYGSIPMMMCWPRHGSKEDEEAPTDYFYADLTGDWDSDGDGFFGEYGEDNVDFAPEVYVGRIPVYNNDVDTLDSILTKIMNYRDRYSGEDWRYRILMPVAITNYRNEDNSKCERTDGLDLPTYVIENILPSPWNHFVLYERAGLDPVPVYAPYYNKSLTKYNVINEWSKGYGAVFWRAHGNKDGAYRKVWINDDGDGIPESDEMSLPFFFTSQDTDSLNDSRPAFTYQCSCLNGYPEYSSNLGYSLLKRGAVATVSASRSSWYTTGYWQPNGDADNVEIGYRYFGNLIRGRMNAGDALYKAKNSLLSRDAKRWMNKFDFNLYGDPSSSIYKTSAIYVPDDYAKIQWAVDNASDGGTIIVRDGTYYENIIVNKQLTIKSENGYANCIINGTGSNVFVLNADGIRIEGFTITGGWNGIYLLGSDKNRIRNNKFINNGLFVHYSYGNIVEDNTVNGKPLVYLEDEADELVHNAGQVILVRCTNITVMNSELTNTDVGIELLESDNCLISDSNISSNNGNGIELENSNNNRISDSTISSNNGNGIELGNSNNNYISNSTISTNNGNGIELGNSNNNHISDSTISSSKGAGIALYDSYENRIRNNKFINGGLHAGTYLYGNIVEDNTVNGKPLVYLEDEADELVRNAGQVILVGCTNITVMNSELTNTNVGIELFESDNCLISNNNISSNIWGGILIIDSNDNIIYANNFINNTCNAFSFGSANIWNSTEEITYTYKGSTYTNYMGNYWDNYTGSDANTDGIGDTPYSIDGDEDYHPLREPFEIYFAVPTFEFDTGQPANPYPSISGKFVGTIEANCEIVTDELYTYACAGTGGHTEYALICNDTWCAEAPWGGYERDREKIVFNTTVVLMPHEQYNVTLITGSYPQIHHNKTLTMPYGEITCTKFIDANGKVYHDWIPAIKLKKSDWESQRS
ncbi:MAG: C25 family cysteine peptidase [Methanophagales archaeon]|nr:C25 family cysteine peptidase [Methanophagales archaeon]